MEGSPPARGRCLSRGSTYSPSVFEGWCPGQDYGDHLTGALGSLLGHWLFILSGDNGGETLMHTTQVKDLIRFILLCFF